MYQRNGIQKVLLLIAIIEGIQWGFISAILGPYLREIGYSATEYGILRSISLASGVFVTFISGLLSDVLGAKKIFAFGLLLNGVGYLLIYTGIDMLLPFGFLISGLAASLISTSSTALVGRSIEDRRLHYVYSYVSGFITYGIALGSFLGWIPIYYSEVSRISILESYRLGMLSIALTWMFISPLALTVTEYRGYVEGKSLSSVIKGLGGFDRLFYIIILLSSIIGFGASISIYNIDYYFILKFGVRSGELGSIFGVENLIMASIMMILPNLSDRYGGEIRIYLVLSLVSIPLLLGMTFTDLLIYASALFIIRTILMNVANPLFSAYVMKLIPIERRGVASAFLNMSWNIPSIIGVSIGGYMLDIDVELPIRVTALLYTISLIGLYHVTLRGGDDVKSNSYDSLK